MNSARKKYYARKSIQDELKVNEIIPFLKLFSLVNAYYRFEKHRKYKTNDYYDIAHSCIAVAYCDYFFTEDSFCHLLNSKLLNLERRFKTRIESRPERVLEILIDLN